MSEQLAEDSPQAQAGSELLHIVDMSEAQSEASVGEAIRLALPNLVETMKTAHEIREGRRTSLRPLFVCPPLPGRYTTRSGDRLSRRDLIGAVDEWLDQTNNHTRFIIQGGNRYISSYASETYDHTIPDIKVMSVEKAPLSVQLLTVLSAEERQSPVGEERLKEVAHLLPPEIISTASSMSRAELLQAVAACNIRGPFSPVTLDENLQEELSEAVERINQGVVIPNQELVTALMEGTEVADMLQRDEPIYFLDDLFYRGRTLYSLAILMTACGGDPTNMRLTTLSSDVKSRDLESPFHNVLRKDTLYPFENSIRTEQGYWQDTGTHYLFTDMGAYWEYLHSVVDIEQSQASYDEWQVTMGKWSDQHLTESLGKMDMSLVGPLLWLSVYHSNFDLDLDINRIVDQKGYKIGACVPFAQLIDRFISQEEPVEARRQFKDQVRYILSAIEEAATSDPDSYRSLVGRYGNDQQVLDYQGLYFMISQEVKDGLLGEADSGADRLMDGIAEDIAIQALEQERPIIVGVNGVDGSGKTILSAKLQRYLEKRGLPVTVVHIDDFTRPQSQRVASRDPIERYYDNTFDTDTLRSAILAPLRARQLGSVLLRHENPHDPAQTVEHGYSFTDRSSVVIVEGVFIFRPELSDYFDKKIFVDIPLSEMRERAIERDVPRFGFGVLKKYLTRYIPAQMRYLETVRPFDTADIIINNTDWHNPYIVERNGEANVQEATA